MGKHKGTYRGRWDLCHTVRSSRQGPRSLHAVLGLRGLVWACSKAELWKWEGKFQGAHAEYLDRRVPAVGPAQRLPPTPREGEFTPGQRPWPGGLRGVGGTTALSRLLLPSWPLEKPSSSASLAERRPIRRNPPGHSSPLAVSLSPSTLGLPPLSYRGQPRDRKSDTAGDLGPSLALVPQHQCPLGSTSVAWSSARGGQIGPGSTEYLWKQAWHQPQPQFPPW